MYLSLGMVSGTLHPFSCGSRLLFKPNPAPHSLAGIMHLSLSTVSGILDHTTQLLPLSALAESPHPPLINPIAGIIHLLLSMASGDCLQRPTARSTTLTLQSCGRRRWRS